MTKHVGKTYKSPSICVGVSVVAATVADIVDNMVVLISVIVQLFLIISHISVLTLITGGTGSKTVPPTPTQKATNALTIKPHKAP